MKYWQILVFIGIITLLSGCIGMNSGDFPQNFHMTYQLHPNETFNYSIHMESLKQKTTTSSSLSNQVSSLDHDQIRMEYSEQNQGSRNTFGTPFTVILAPSGEIINSSRLEPLVAGIEPGLPNLLEFPPQYLQKNSLWTVPFRTNGTYLSNNGSVTYDISGASNYTVEGYDRITTTAGRFNCLEIDEYTTYYQNITVASLNGIIISETNGTITGKSWVEKDHGFLVQSKKTISKLVQSDLTDLFKNQKIKYSSVYDEIPVEQQIVCELISWKSS